MTIMAFIKRHAVLLYFVLTFAISFGCIQNGLIMGLGSQGLRRKSSVAVVREFVKGDGLFLSGRGQGEVFGITTRGAWHAVEPEVALLLTVGMIVLPVAIFGDGAQLQQVFGT